MRTRLCVGRSASRAKARRGVPRLCPAKERHQTVYTDAWEFSRGPVSRECCRLAPDEERSVQRCGCKRRSEDEPVLAVPVAADIVMSSVRLVVEYDGSYYHATKMPAGATRRPHWKPPAGRCFGSANSRCRPSAGTKCL